MCFLCFQGAEGVAGFGDAAHQGQSSQKIKWGAEEEAVGGSCCSWEPQGERDGIIGVADPWKAGCLLSKPTNM